MYDSRRRCWTTGKHRHHTKGHSCSISDLTLHMSAALYPCYQEENACIALATSFDGPANVHVLLVLAFFGQYLFKVAVPVPLVVNHLPLTMTSPCRVIIVASGSRQLVATLPCRRPSVTFPPAGCTTQPKGCAVFGRTAVPELLRYPPVRPLGVLLRKCRPVFLRRPTLGRTGRGNKLFDRVIICIPRGPFSHAGDPGSRAALQVRPEAQAGGGFRGDAGDAGRHAGDETHK